MPTLDNVGRYEKGRAELILAARVNALHAALKWAELDGTALTNRITNKAEEFERWLLREP